MAARMPSARLHRGATTAFTALCLTVYVLNAVGLPHTAGQAPPDNSDSTTHHHDNSNAKPTEQAPTTVEHTLSATAWATYTKGLSHAAVYGKHASGLLTTAGRTASTLVEEQVPVLVDKLTETGQRVMSRAQSVMESVNAAAQEETSTGDTSTASGQHNRRRDSNTVRPWDRAMRRLDAMYQQLPNRDDVHQTVCDAAENLPERTEVHKHLMDSVELVKKTAGDTLPSASDVHTNIRHGVNFASQTISRLTGGHMPTFDTAPPPTKSCIYASVAEFDEAFDDVLRAVRDAKTCDTLTDAITHLHRVFSYERIDVDVPACTRLGQRLDESRSIAARQTASLCV
eukprot:m.183349 g.183349  ORF g.183349 m.183349 type:complete len:342 (+) comp15791_c0_seq1:311-1336(+)